LRTRAAGSEGALTKGPFNALPPIYDLNNALVSYLLTGHEAFVTAASQIVLPVVAIECGYADYQHMVRDFGHFTNTRPNAWLEEDSTSPEHVLRPASAGGLL